MSVSSLFVETRKVFGFCIPVCLPWDNGRKIRSIDLKFEKNIHVLSKISKMVFVLHKASDSYTEAHERVTIHCALELVRIWGILT